LPCAREIGPSVGGLADRRALGVRLNHIGDMSFHGPAFLRSAARTTVLARVGLAATLLGLAAPAALGQSPADATQQANAAAPAAQEPIRAVFIDVAGKVQWRAGDKDQWRDAKVNDSVDAGVEIRTGLRSHAALRMRNATVLLDAGTMFQLPQAVQDGEVLRTTAAVRHGRADFKVDKVGLSNDFKVVTPSTTLAVRGTGFAVATGALKQVEVLGARRNAINAIELKYALNNTTVQLSGAASSSSGVHQPAHAAAVGASPPAVSAAAIPTATQAEVVQVAAAGEGPANSGSAAQAQQAARASRKAEKANVITGTASSSGGGGSSGVAAAIRAQIERANRALDQSIAYLLQAEEEGATVDARRDALLALRGLATARRDEAQAALGAHQSALDSARQEELAATDREGTFRQNASGVEQSFASFDSAIASATDSLEAIRAVLAAGQSVPDDAGTGELADALHAALASLGSARSVMESKGDLLRQDRDAIVAAVDALDAGERAAASAAVAAYQGALAALAAQVESGTSEYQVARSARDAVASLQALIAGLSQEVGTAALRQKAQSALERLESASGGLSSALSALEAIKAARAQAQGDPRAADLGEVESIYARLVSLRVRVLAEWSGLSEGIASRDAGYGGLLSDSAALLEQVGQRYLERGTQAASQATQSVAQASSGRAAALGSLSSFGQARASADLRESQVLAAEDRFDGRAEAFAAHAADFSTHQSAAIAVLAAINDILSGGNGGETGGGTGGGTPQFVGLGGTSPGQGGLPGSELGPLIEELRTALLALGDSRDGAQVAQLGARDERVAIEGQAYVLGTQERVTAQSAVGAYQSALAQLNDLVAAGASRAELSAAADDAVQRLRAVVLAIQSGLQPGTSLPAAQRALERLESAASGFAQTAAALDVLASARDDAAGAGQDAALDQVEELYGRVLAVRLRVLADAAAIDLEFDQIQSDYESTLAAAEAAIGGAGEEFTFAALFASFGSELLAQGVDDRLSDAQRASDERAAVAGEAEEFEAWAMDVAAVEDRAAEATARLEAIGTQSLGGSGSQIEQALGSLGLLDEALAAVLAKVSDPESDFGERLPGLGLESLAERASAALEAILQAESEGAGGAAQSRAVAGLAAAVVADAERLAEVATELKERLGISDALAAQAAAVVAQLAQAADGSATRAEQASAAIGALALAAKSDRVGSVLARLESLVQSREWETSGGLDLLARAQQAYRGTNEHGAATFASLALGARAAIDPVASSATEDLDAVSRMASLSSEMVTALDGAEGAAGEAERLRDVTIGLLAQAESHEADTVIGLANTGNAVEAGDLQGAAAQRDLTVFHAEAARGAATGAAGAADGARQQHVAAQGFAADVDRLGDEVQAFGTNSAQFAAAAKARAQAVAAAAGQVESLRAEVVFFNGVVQQLAGNAGTTSAAASAGSSVQALLDANAIAAQLAGVAAGASEMAQTASTNAGRLFGQSVFQYVARALSASNVAAARAQQADQAAGRAEANAASAAALVAGAGNGGQGR
jgi:hypothetical protein